MLFLEAKIMFDRARLGFKIHDSSNLFYNSKRKSLENSHYQISHGGVRNVWHLLFEWSLGVFAARLLCWLEFFKKKLEQSHFFSLTEFSRSSFCLWFWIYPWKSFLNQNRVWTCHLKIKAKLFYKKNERKKCFSSIFNTIYL